MFRMLRDEHCTDHRGRLAIGLVTRVPRNCEKVDLVHVLCFDRASCQENMSL